MYCPQCGQQQTSDVIRYCSRCGFLLDGVIAVLGAGGALPQYLVPGRKQLSPRSKGVRQGAVLMLSTFLVVPIVAVLTINLFSEVAEIVVPLAALICFVGGLMRMLYALLMEDPYPQVESRTPAVQAAPSLQFERNPRHAALPAPPANPAVGWRPNPNTGEIYRPPSVTENTTRLLDKDDPKKR
ncbi:MAG TPA: hypothetical protein VK208_05345 [Pyrinomonadaceae bacterium]|nr:hypothetical protein [Pyrinomonadaceae bacterium]